MSDKYKTLVDLWEKSCEKFADRELFGSKKDGGWSWMKYSEFKKLVDDFRGGLKSLGVGEGDKVGIIADNRVEWAVACYATYGLGAAFVPMYQAQLPKEWEFILGDCGAKVAIGATNEIVDKLNGIKGNVPTLEHVIGLELDESDDHSYAALLKRGAEEPADVFHPDPSAVAGLIYTSGTTGKPKGVVLSHSNLAENINAIKEWFTFEPDDRSLSFLPWAHSFGQVCELHSLLGDGCSMGINDEVPSLVANLAEVRPTVLFAVPRIFNRIYDGVNKQMQRQARNHSVALSYRDRFGANKNVRANRSACSGASVCSLADSRSSSPRSARSSVGASSTRSAAARRSNRRWPSSSMR